MFQTPGFYPHELGDIDVLAHDGVLHLYFLTLPSHDMVSHAFSTDGLSWTPAPIALRTGDPGECDDDMIWTMHTVRKPDGGGFNMYYTACSFAEAGHVQRVALAESTDLNNWSKHSANPILESLAPHYNDNFDLVGFISFRDPYVFIEDGTWHMFVTARGTEGQRLRRGCVAHATSTDGVTWEAQPPLYAPQSIEDLEVPAVLKIEGRYYLFFNVFSVGHTAYRVGDSLDGPWRAPENDVLLPPCNTAMRFCRWGDKLLAWHWLRTDADWHKRAGATYSALVPPKDVKVEADGSLYLAPFDGWSGYHQGEAVTLTATDFAERCGPGAPWQETSAGGLRAQVYGQATTRAAGTYSDFILECTVVLEAGQACGVAFRSDEEFEVATWVRLDFTRHSVELHRTMSYDSSYKRYKLKQPTIIQSSPVELSRGRQVHLRILACREYLEVSIDGRVYLSAASWKRPDGQVALWVNEGTAEFSPLTIQPLTAPETGKAR